MKRIAQVVRSVAATLILSLALLVELAAQEPLPGFTPLKSGDVKETLPAAQLVYAAYAAVWLVLLTYVFILWRRASRIEQGLAAVNDRLEKR